MEQAQRDRFFMGLALAQAQRAAALGEVPVGAVVVRGGAVISAAGNRRQTKKRALAHAECAAIDLACRALGGWRLPGCTLYVTLEPCPMCAGAAINARIERLVYGAADPKAGCCGSLLDLFAFPFNHHPEVVGGVLAGESAALLRAFFQERRRGGGHWKKETACGGGEAVSPVKLTGQPDSRENWGPLAGRGAGLCGLGTVPAEGTGGETYEGAPPPSVRPPSGCCCPAQGRGDGPMAADVYKLEIFIPPTHFEALRQALMGVDAGHIGKYDGCLSYSEVAGCWRPLAGSRPYAGEEGTLCWGTEYKVEVCCRRTRLEETLAAVKAVHPYEEPVINVIPLYRTGL